MVNFAQLQGILKERLDVDRTIRTVDTEGPTLEVAVSEAATLLNLPVRRIEYEIVERGFPGFMGAGKKIWKIHAYKLIVAEQETVKSALDEGETETVTAMSQDKDGEAFAHLFDGGVWLKVTPPVGNGKPVTIEDARQALIKRKVREIFEDTLHDIVAQKRGAYVQVGKFERNLINDSMVQVSVTDQDMKAFVTAIPPGPGGCDLSAETIIAALKANRVVHGFKDDVISDFVDKPVYKNPFLAAEGSKSINGRDSYVQYYFETDTKKVQIKEQLNGSVDFKDTNMVQNVVASQPLAKKMPAEQGIEGKTVYGAYLPAKNGEDCEVSIGSNVHMAEDGETIVSDINGQVLMVGGRISVEPILNIQGNVNLKTGDIIFLGSVFITGNVEDGFSVKAEGDIEVKGTVGKAELEAEGSIRALKGITGRNEGMIRAGKTVYAKFVENATVEAGDSVIVADGIINSQVTAFKRIVCQGKRASIVGGYLKATEEISAKTIGSAAGGTETICEVGFDPRLKAELDVLIEKKKDLEHLFNEVKLNLQTLSKLKQLGELPPDKQAAMRDLITQRNLLSKDSQELTSAITEKQNELNAAASMGRISASDKVLPGVKIVLRDKVEKVHTEYKAVTFILENELIRPQRYEESKETAAILAAEGIVGAK